MTLIPVKRCRHWTSPYTENNREEGRYRLKEEGVEHEEPERRVGRGFSTRVPDKNPLGAVLIIIVAVTVVVVTVK